MSAACHSYPHVTIALALQCNKLNWGHPTFFYQSQDEFRTKESEFVHIGPIANEGLAVKSSFPSTKRQLNINWKAPQKTLGGPGWVRYTVMFHFWHYHLWPKLASLILKFSSRKRSLQWYPDQSGCTWVNWALLHHLLLVKWHTVQSIYNSRAPVAWRVAKQSTILMGTHMNCFSYIQYVASVIACRCVHKSRNMAVVLQPWFTASIYIFAIEFDMHVIVNWPLSKQGIHWPVSCDHIARSRAH